MKSVPVFITAQELSELIELQGNNLFIVDCRGKKNTNHTIPGAVRLGWLDFVEGLQNGKLVGVEKAEKLLRELGLCEGNRVVVFGTWTEAWGEEGRMFWMFDYFGCNVSCLIGGFKAWQTTGFPVGSSAPKPHGNFVAKPDDSKRAYTAEVEIIAKGRSAGVVVDCRTRDEYSGKRKIYDKLRKSTGHVVGAVHVHWKDACDSNGNLLEAENLKKLYKLEDCEKSIPIVLYCTGGVRSGFSYMVLKSIGIENVKNYDDSWWGWVESHSVSDGLVENPNHHSMFRSMGTFLLHVIVLVLCAVFLTMVESGMSLAIPVTLIVLSSLQLLSFFFTQTQTIKRITCVLLCIVSAIAFILFFGEVSGEMKTERFGVFAGVFLCELVLGTCCFRCLTS